MIEIERCEHNACGADNRLEYCVGDQERSYIDAEVVVDLIDEVLYSFDVAHDYFSLTVTQQKNQRVERSFSVLGADEGETPELAIRLAAKESKSGIRDYWIEVQRGRSFRRGSDSMDYVKKYRLSLYPDERVYGMVQDIDYRVVDNRSSVEFANTARDVSSYDLLELFDDLAQIIDLHEIERQDNKNIARFRTA